MTVSVPSRFETEHVPNLRQKRSCYDEIIHVKVAIILYRTYYEQEAVYVQSNIKTRARNHCCRGKAISITHSKRARV